MLCCAAWHALRERAPAHTGDAGNCRDACARPPRTRSPRATMLARRAAPFGFSNPAPPARNCAHTAMHAARGAQPCAHNPYVAGPCGGLMCRTSCVRAHMGEAAGRQRPQEERPRGSAPRLASSSSYSMQQPDEPLSTSPPCQSLLTEGLYIPSPFRTQSQISSQIV